MAIVATANCVSRRKALRIRGLGHVNIKNQGSGTQSTCPACGAMALRIGEWGFSFAIVVPCWREAGWRDVASGFRVLSLNDRNH